MRNFDLVHFICPYTSKHWLPRFRDFAPCVTSHHHATDYSYVEHNFEGDAIVVGSNEWREDLQAHGIAADKIFCIPYGVDTEQFKPADETSRLKLRRKLGIEEGATVIGFFAKKSSNEVDRKGTDIFAKAIHGLSHRLSGVTALIVGPGWKEMVEDFRSTGIKCIWFPFLNDKEDLVRMYSALDFYWITARVEGGPVTLLEAMSSEICCVTTPVGLARDIVIDGSNAVLIPFDDANGFINRTCELLNDKSKRRQIEKQARRTILQEMDVGITMPRVRDAYIGALKAFAERRKSDATKDVQLIADSVSQRKSTLTEINIPLNGIPLQLQCEVKILESLLWGENLMLYQHQKVVGLKIICREWLANPLSLLPPRILFRSLLPNPLVSKMISLKAFVRTRFSISADSAR